MKKIFLAQSPPHYYYKLIPVLYEALARQGYYDKMYIVTNAKPVELGRLDWVSEYLTTISKQECNSNKYLEYEHIILDKDMDFTENIRKALDFVSEEFFVMDCEDHIPTALDKTKIDMCFDSITHNNKIGCIRLNRKVLKMMVADDKQLVSEVISGQEGGYCACLQPTIWRKSFLQQVLSGRTAWEFEKTASRIARHSKGARAFCVNTQVYHYQNWMKRGGYYRDAFVEFMKQHSIDYDIKNTKTYQIEVLGKKIK